MELILKLTLEINPVLRYHPVTVSIYTLILKMVYRELFADKILEDGFVLVLGKKFNLKILKFSNQDKEINK